MSPPGRFETPSMDKTRRLNVAFILIATVGLLLAQYVARFAATTTTLTYSEFETLVAEHAIRSAVVTDRHIVGEFAAPRQGKTRFEVTRVDPDLAAHLRASGIDVSGGDESLITNLLSWVVPALVLFGLWWMLNRWFAKRLGAGDVLTIGKSRANVYVE
jgi:cell division protease FtsH